MIAEAHNQDKRQLYGRDPLTLSDLGRAFEDLEVMPKPLQRFSRVDAN